VHRNAQPAKRILVVGLWSSGIVEKRRRRLNAEI